MESLASFHSSDDDTTNRDDNLLADYHTDTTLDSYLEDASLARGDSPSEVSPSRLTSYHTTTSSNSC